MGISFVGTFCPLIRSVLMAGTDEPVLRGVVEGVAVLVHDVFTITDFSLALTNQSPTGLITVLPLLDLFRAFLVFSLSLPVGLDFSSGLPAVERNDSLL